MSRRAWVSTFLLLIAFYGTILIIVEVASARAPVKPGPTLAQSFQIADDWIKQYGLDNPCSAMDPATIIWEDQPSWEGKPAGDGQAHGWRFVDDKPFWDRTLCSITLKKRMGPIRTCEALGHELMHFAYGPEHTGPLTPYNGPPRCGRWKMTSEIRRSINRRYRG